jgi:hypothetical protein
MYMKRLVTYLLLLFPLFLFSSQSKYQDNYSCKECHDKIYEEYQSSYHSKGYFNDELHRQIADKVSAEKYDCATCHMPMADNIEALIAGEARPDKSNKTHTDAISCYFCHTIAYVKKAHRFNINTKARQAEGYKPTLYGRLQNPDDNDKHSSVENPVYAKKVCTGCHSHKLNENNVTIFRAMGEKQDSMSCIKCHMPEIEGGSDKINKRARKKHASHEFLGIHDKDMRAKSVDIDISSEGEQLKITLTNKMDHPLIIQSARAKYLVIRVIRDGKVIWKNFDKHPSEDNKAYFAASFKRDGKKILIPATATEQDVVNNLGAKKSKTFVYSVKNMKKGDEIHVSFYVKLAKDDCLRAIDLKDRSTNKPLLMKEVQTTIK